MTPLHLSKHHALGNDFLVLVDVEGRHGIDAGLARRLCDRHRGVGADGLLRAGPGRDGADVTMEVRNADGGRAETSGNGIRCLAQAVVEAGVVEGPVLSVATAAGVRRLTLGPGDGPGGVVVEVDMGPATLGPERTVEAPGERARPVDMGNPHLVVLGPDPRRADLEALGPRLEADHPQGVNVELVTVGPARDELTMRVWERGVGETMACGSGACAAAAATHDWGLVGPRVVVHQPGGAVQVSVGPGTVVLTGPAQHVARIEVDLP
ncbi:MAG: diaminopimelate epimerase [Actinomycetota bacterium]|nr:diaminopimelate epimerase [Actinomycetota bacterium]